MMQGRTVMEMGFEGPLWNHTEQRRHHQARSTSCPGKQLDDMMQVMESDCDCCWVLNLGLWTVLHGGDVKLMNWLFDHLVQMSLSVVKNHDAPADRDRSYYRLIYITGRYFNDLNVYQIKIITKIKPHLTGT
jgi:hypothetical protein